jgi:hypothetical protein
MVRTMDMQTGCDGGMAPLSALTIVPDSIVPGSSAQSKTRVTAEHGWARCEPAHEHAWEFGGLATSVLGATGYEEDDDEDFDDDESFGDDDDAAEPVEGEGTESEDDDFLDDDDEDDLDDASTADDDDDDL